MKSLPRLLWIAGWVLSIAIHGDCVRAAAAQMNPFAPRALLYAGFDSTTNLSTPSPMSVDRATLEPGRFGNGLSIAKGDRTGSTVRGRDGTFDPLRGSLVFWFKLNSKETAGPPEIASVWGQGAHVRVAFRQQGADPKKPDQIKPGEFTFDIDGEEFVSGPVALTPGDWHHVAWTWWGLRHVVYVDGKIGGTKLLASPMKPRLDVGWRVGVFAGGKQDAVVDEFACYNVALNSIEVGKVFTATNAGPLTAFEPHGLEVTAAWAPGEAKVHVTADAGNDFAEQADALAFAVVDGTGAELALGKIFPLRRGFGETVLSMKAMPAGSYHVKATLLDHGGNVLTSKLSEIYELPATRWLGNHLGITDAIQPPWTPIEREGSILKISGRRMDFAGGFGFPQQIESVGERLLARPIGLEIEKSGAMLALTDSRVEVVDVRTYEATWAGSARAPGVKIDVRGRMEYDGFTVFTLRLAPEKSPIALDAIRLQMAMPAERALFIHATTDQTYWWYTYKANTPREPGVFHDNLRQKAGKSSFLPVVLFSDHDRALEWFAENPAGWMINETKPVQKMIRDPDGVVRLECSFANEPFTLDRPIEITFGVMATPVKPLPANWRTAYVNHHRLPLRSDLSLWWSWPDDAGAKGRQGNFNLCPVDIEAYRKTFQAQRLSGIKIAPFVNAHVLLAHPPDDWPGLMHILEAETQSDGWVAQPTCGFRDYWAYQLNRALDGDALDAIYIDESYGFGSSAALLSGGYAKPDGTHGFGYNLFGLREQLKRTRQLFIDHHKQPLVWLHTTANMWPHAWSFVDVVSEGESFEFKKPGGESWMDAWGSRLLEGKSGYGTTGGPWLMSIGRAQKFGFIPIFLNYIRYYSAPEYPGAVREMHGLLTLLDVIPIEYQTGKLALVKQDFGIGESDVRFHGYWEQRALAASREDVKASFYRRTNSALAIVANLGKEPFDGSVTVDWSALGFESTKTKLRDAESGSKLKLVKGLLPTKLSGHDFRMIRFDAAEFRN